MIIRNANHDDLPGLDIFFELVLRDVFEKENLGHRTEILEQEISSKQSQIRNVLDQTGQRDVFLVAEESGDIIGTVAYIPCNAVICSLSKGELESYGEVGTVFVRPDRQKQGIGRALRTAMDQALLDQGITEYVLDTGYGAAQNYWKQQLGDPIIVAVDYWGDGHDHLVWKVDLTEKA